MKIATLMLDTSPPHPMLQNVTKSLTPWGGGVTPGGGGVEGGGGDNHPPPLPSGW